MKVKLFDFEHEKDLEEAINKFLQTENITVVSIHYASSHFFAVNEQVFSFSSLILYENDTKKI